MAMDFKDAQKHMLDLSAWFEARQINTNDAVNLMVFLLATMTVEGAHNDADLQRALKILGRLIIDTTVNMYRIRSEGPDDCRVH